MKLTRLNDLIENGKPLKGRWELTPDNELVYRAEDKSEEIRFKGSLVAAEPDALVVSVIERQADQKIVTSLVKLAGMWRANAKNQLTFEVQKESGKNDVLTFRGGWEVDERHRIVYTWQRTELKKRAKTTQELAFDGYWEISERNRLTYSLGGDNGSNFRFRGAFQTQSILAKKGEIRYQIGVEVGGRRKMQTVALFGKWKVSRDLGLDFEIQCGDRKRILTFGGTYELEASEQITVNLRSEKGKPLGAEVILTQDIFGKDGQFFVRLQKSLEETRLESGMTFKW